MKQRFRNLLRSAAAAISLALSGCSSDSVAAPPVRDAGADSSGNPRDAAADSAALPLDGNACAPAASQSDCRAAPSGAACRECCSCFHPEGVDAYNQALTTCVCAADHCAAQCATSLCATPARSATPGDACDLCAKRMFDPDAGAACASSVAAGCNASPDCAALLACVNGKAQNDPNACPSQ